MVEQILKQAKINFRKTRFTTAQKSNYWVYDENIQTDGDDFHNRIYTHTITLEGYLIGPDESEETAVENALDSFGIQWEKQARLWLQDEQRYQVVYEFEYTNKHRKDE